MRLYNTKQYNLQGIGNPYYGKCIVVPNVDYVAYKNGSMGFSTQVEIIQSLISIDDVFITPLIKCNETISCEVTKEIYNNCLTYLANEIKTYNFKDILLLGEAGRRFFDCNINDYFDNIIISPNNRRYAVNYSPLVKYIDENKFHLFETQLRQWINAVRNYNFNQYKFLRI